MTKAIDDTLANVQRLWEAVRQEQKILKQQTTGTAQTDQIETPASPINSPNASIPPATGIPLTDDPGASEVYQVFLPMVSKPLPVSGTWAWKPDDGSRLQDFAFFRDASGYYYISALYKDNPGAGFRYARSTQPNSVEAWDDLGLILPHGPPDAPDSDMVWAPHVVESDGSYFQYYTAVREHEVVLPDGTIQRQWEQSIMVAQSVDPADPDAWTRLPLVGTADGAFRPTHPGAEWEAGGWAHCRDPMVFRDPDPSAAEPWHLYYTGRDTDGAGIVGHATAPAPEGPWFDHGRVAAINDGHGGIPESPFVLQTPDNGYVLTFNHAGAEPGGSQMAVADSLAGPFEVASPLTPGWAHEWLTRSDDNFWAAYLKDYNVYISPAHWTAENQPVIAP